MKKTNKPTALLRRFDSKTNTLQQERLTVTPVDVLLESFSECWPFHKTTQDTDDLDRTHYVVYVYATQEAYTSDNPFFTFTIDPLEA